jgi:hypothetical protein
MNSQPVGGVVVARPARNAASVERLAATLMFARRDRRSVMPKKVPPDERRLRHDPRAWMTEIGPATARPGAP